MLPAYNDIRRAVGKPPVWYDTHGVPRYTTFHPELLGVYDQYALLAHVKCAAPNCEAVLAVGDGRPRMTISCAGDQPYTPVSLDDWVEHWSFGDPPRHDCPGAGETMSSNLEGIAEAWERVDLDWQRRYDLETVPR